MRNVFRIASSLGLVLSSLPLALIACESGDPKGAEPIDASHEGLLSDTRSEMIGGVTWNSTTISPMVNNVPTFAGSAAFNGQRFVVQSRGCGAAYENWPNDPDPQDTLQFVYTRVSGTVLQQLGGYEIVVRVAGMSNPLGPDGGVTTKDSQAGVMIREAPSGLSDPIGIGALPTRGAMGAGFFSLGTPYIGCESPNGEISSIGVSSRTRRMPPDNPTLGWTIQGNTRHQPPSIWLRLQLVRSLVPVPGQSSTTATHYDFTSSHSADGQHWVATPGGDVSVTNDLLVGFYASGEHTHPERVNPASAEFDNVYVGPPRLAQRTSFIGSSSSSSSRGWITREMQGFYVAPSGASATYTNNGLEELPGKKRTVNAFSSDGLVYKVPDEASTLSAPFGGITGDGTYAYLARFVTVNNVRSDFVERRALPNLALVNPQTFVPVPGRIAGIAAGDGRLFVSDWSSNLVRVFNASTGAPVGSFAFTNPGLLAVQPNVAGSVWVTATATDPATPVPYFVTSSTFTTGGPTNLRCFQPNGSGSWNSPVSCGTVNFSTLGVDNATAFAFFPASAPQNGSLLIADNGPHQRVRICSNLLTTPTCSNFGVDQGAFAGPIPGLVEAAGSPRFFSPRGVGADSSGNIYVASGAPRVDVRKFSANGTPLWSKPIQGLGPEPGAFDPGFNGTGGNDFYTLTRHLTFNPANTAPGSEWASKAVTWNPFNAVGNDPDVDVQRFSWTVPGAYSPAPWMRRILKAGESTPRLFMFTSDLVGTNIQFVKAYCQTGEIFKPCAALEWTSGSSPSLTVWNDSNHDGQRFPTSEVTSLPVGSLQGGFAADVDNAGNIWLLFGKTFGGAQNQLYKLAMTELDGAGTPVYQTSLTPVTVPGFPSGAEPTMFRYDSATSRLVMHALVPLTTQQPVCGFGERAAAALRWNGWPSSPTALPQVLLPFPVHHRDQPEDVAGLFYDSLCGCSSSSCQGCEDDSWYYTSLDVAGDYFFIQEYYGAIHVHHADTGVEVARLMGGPEISGRVLNPLDRDTMRAFKRGSEYLITFTDVNDIGARTPLYRWTPGPFTPQAFAPMAWYSADATTIVDGDPGAGVSVAQWNDRSGNSRHVVQTIAANRPTFVSNGWSATKPALSFNGSTAFLYSSIWGSAPPNGVEKPYTVLAVFQPTSVQRSGLASWYGTFGGGWVTARLIPNGPSLVPESARYDVNAASQTFTSSFAFGSGAKHLLAYSYDGAGTFSIRLDGQNLQSNTPPPLALLSSIGATEMPFLIGWEHANSPSNKFAGKLAELIVVDRALTLAELETYRSYATTQWGF